MLKLTWQNKKMQNIYIYMYILQRRTKWGAAEMTFKCDWQNLSYHASQRHVELTAHAVQAFKDTLLPAGLCERAHTQKNLASNNTNALVSKQKRNVSKTLQARAERGLVGEEEEQVRSDEDQSWQTDLSLAHVGQRLFEMLGRSRRMARGQLAGINKQERKECYSTLADREIRRKTQRPFYLKNNSIQGPKFNLWAVLQSSGWVRTNSQQFLKLFVEFFLEPTSWKRGTNKD